MRLSFPTHRLAVAAVIAGGALGVLGGAGSAGATVPGTNGTIVATKCEDGDPCNIAHLWTVDPVTGSEQALTSDPNHWDDDSVISPDGTRVAYQRCTDSSMSSCGIALIGVEGGTPVDLTTGPNDDYPAFSPDGSKIVFSRGTTFDTHLFVVNVNGGDPQPITSGSVEDRYADWSPDGSSIIFTRYTGASGSRIYKLTLGGGSPVPLTAGPTDYLPGFSPDGSQIAFSGAGIEIMDPNGGNRHTLTSPSPDYDDYGPVFSPDGEQIVFSRYTHAAPRQSPLWVVNADGSNQHAISPDYFYGADWQATHPAPPASPPPAQTPAPTLTLAAPKKESIRKGRVYLFATSSKAATGAVGGKVSVPKLAKSYRLRTTTKALGPNTRTKITLKLPAKTLRAARSALARHERVKATLVVRIKDSAGNATSKQIKVRLTK